MRKFLWLLIIPVLALCSFFQMRSGVKKIGTNLYSLSRASKVADADKESLKQIIATHYGIKEFTKTMVFSANDARNKASGSIIESSVYKDFFSSHFISWKKNAQLPDDATKAQGILAKYAAM